MHDACQHDVHVDFGAWTPTHGVPSGWETMGVNMIYCTQELRAKLLAEAEHSARNNASVAMRWADLFSIEVPQVCD